MKKILLFLFLVNFCYSFSFSQNLADENFNLLAAKEDSMKVNADNIINADRLADRFKADSLFTRQLVKALKVPYSFNYDFDSLVTISRLYSPDSSFRIFTWALKIDEEMTRQHGAIQMKTADGSLKLFPLIDRSDVTEKFRDTIADNLGWMGAIYYRILLNKSGDKKVYTLLGYDENNFRSSKKIIEILTFSEGKPLFGGYYFNISNDSILPRNSARYVVEFKKDASPRLNYDEDMKMIIMEHLVSESNEPKKKWTLVGDGDYEGLIWSQGKWTYVPKVFKQITPEGDVPVPTPMKESKMGKRN